MKKTIKNVIENVTEDDMQEKDASDFIADIVDLSGKKRMEIFTSFNDMSDSRWKNETIISDLKSGRMKLPLESVVPFFKACGLKTTNLRKACCIVLKAYLPEELAAYVKTPFVNDTNEVIKRFSTDLYLKTVNADNKFKAFKQSYYEELSQWIENDISKLSSPVGEEERERLIDSSSDLCVDEFLANEFTQQINTLEILSNNSDEADILLLPFDNFLDVRSNSKIDLIRGFHFKISPMSVLNHLIQGSKTPYETVPTYVMLLRLAALFSEETGLELYANSKTLIGSDTINNNAMFSDLERKLLKNGVCFATDEQRIAFINFCQCRINRATALGSTLFTAINSEKKLITALRDLNLKFYQYSQHRPKFELSYTQSVERSYPILKDKKARLFAKKLKFIFCLINQNLELMRSYRQDFLDDSDSPYANGGSEIEYDSMISLVNEGLNDLYWNSGPKEVQELVTKTAKMIAERVAYI
ncbi:MAG: hypothetical protein ACI9O6_000898 [Glaciecola sp.]|jgi:hypothetical protein